MREPALNRCPAQRRRALTLPSSSSTATESSTQKPISQQKKSPFFNKLPLEIRRLIYQEVLAPSRYPTLGVGQPGNGPLLSRRCAAGTIHSTQLVSRGSRARPPWMEQYFMIMET